MNKHKNHISNFESTLPPWSDALVLVCEKCCDKQEVSAKDFRKEVKHLLKEQGMGHQARVVSCSCLGVCPKNNITLAVALPRSAVPFSVLLLPVKPNAAQVAKFIEAQLRGENEHVEG